MLRWLHDVGVDIRKMVIRRTKAENREEWVNKHCARGQGPLRAAVPMKEGRKEVK